MRTMIIILGGLALLGLALLTARWIGGTGTAPPVTAAKGVAPAGYSVAEELPIFLLIFAVPAAAAGFAWWKFQWAAAEPCAAVSGQLSLAVKATVN
jgi:hypothetical protein